MSEVIGYSNEKGFVGSDGTPFELETDANGVLKNGNKIIPQKKILWEGTATATAEQTTATVDLSENLSVGDVVEVYIDNEMNRQPFRFIVTSLSGGLYTFSTVRLWTNATIIWEADISIPSANTLQITATYYTNDNGSTITRKTTTLTRVQKIIE